MSETVTPSKRSCTSTRRVHSRGAPPGRAPSTVAQQRRPSRHRVGLAAEVELGPQARRRTGRACRPSARPGRTACGAGRARRAAQRGEVALHRRLDAGPLHLDDDRLAGVQPRPVGLADRGRGERLPVELGEDLVDGRAQLRLEDRGDALPRLGRHAVLQLGQLVAELGRQEVDAGGGDLAELDVHPAGLLEHPPQAHAGRVDRALGPLRGRQERAEALLAAEPDELAVAAQHGDPPAHRAERAGRDDEAGPLADGQRAGPGEQVEGDGGGHRRRDADGHEVDDESVGAPVPAVQPEGDEQRPCPSRSTPASSAVPQPRRHPEQPQRQTS